MSGAPVRPVREVLVAGGGISGLSAAYFVQQQARAAGAPVQITLLESSARLGGALSTRREGGFLLEEGAESFLRTKPAAIRLCEELGIGGSLIPTLPGGATLIVRNGRLLPLPEGFHLFAPTSFWPLVTTPVFSWTGKLRMALDLLLPRGGAGRDGGSERDESVASFVRRRLGSEALERLAQPLVAGIWSGDPDAISLRATLPQWLEMETKHRSLILALRRQIRAGKQPDRASGARYGLFLTLRGGMGELVDALAARLPPEALRTGVAITALERAGGRWQVSTTQGRLEADDLILALPIHAAAELLRDVEPEVSRELRAIPVCSSATLNLVYRAVELPAGLDGYGFLCPEVEKRPILACTFTSRKYEGRCDEGHVILRAYVGGSCGELLLGEDDESLVRSVGREMRDLLGISVAPVVWRLRRFVGVLPQYLPGHLERVARIEQRVAMIPGLALAGNALRGVGVSDCVEGAGRAAVLITGNAGA